MPAAPQHHPKTPISLRLGAQLLHVHQAKLLKPALLRNKGLPLPD
ncbi:MAG TPA: hypothetical protein VNZ27_03725 [Rhodanobacter sp.]|jgi:hypothetical protein|nr:hypothetical protein [Rhodanobacter sp.]